ncbi:hypothetical protein [Bacteroides sp. AN502(2024)]|uniref:hypothetical protein n=1 Tax=Bacteroides sp. AN502(2024) TaxID=3160599 RepID=UPI0035143075
MKQIEIARHNSQPTISHPRNTVSSPVQHSHKQETPFPATSIFQAKKKHGILCKFIQKEKEISRLLLYLSVKYARYLVTCFFPNGNMLKTASPACFTEKTMWKRRILPLRPAGQCLETRFHPYQPFKTRKT